MGLAPTIAALYAFDIFSRMSIATNRSSNVQSWSILGLDILRLKGR